MMLRRYHDEQSEKQGVTTFKDVNPKSLDAKEEPKKSVKGTTKKRTTKG